MSLSIRHASDDPVIQSPDCIAWLDMHLHLPIFFSMDSVYKEYVHSAFNVVYQFYRSHRQDDKSVPKGAAV